MAFSPRSSNTRYALSLLTMLTLLFLTPGASQAHRNATGIVKERMDMMEKLGKGMKAIKPMVRKSSAFDAQRIARIATQINQVSPKLAAKFPEGSIHGPSEALPAIWEDWQRFEDLLNQMEKEAAELSRVAAGGDRRKALRQFVVLGKTCKSCHKDFREKKKD